MKIALCQMKMSEYESKNIIKSLEYIKKASENNVDIIIFPELQLTKFFPQYKGLDVKGKSTVLNGKILDSFCDVCAKYKIAAVPNLYLRDDDKYYDASFLIDKKGNICGCQKMVHIAMAENFYEQDYYCPSDEGFKVFETELGKIGIVVCFDRHYPESIRTEVLMGADLILIPTANTKAEPLEMFEWEVRVQAFQNSVAIAMCNRVGKEDNMCFAGQSIITDAKGTVIVKADDSEGLFYGEIDLAESRKIRGQKPYTNLRTPKFYK